MTLLRFRDVALRRGVVTALDGLSFEVARGERVALVGPSGCGKTTALRLAAGLDAPDAGAVEWPDGRPRAGIVFQDPTLLPWASAFDNVRLPLRLAGADGAAARARVEEALALVGLADSARLRPRELSGGMRMRVSLARALVTGAELLLLDEPFAALDEPTRRRLNDDLLALVARAGATLLFVTHSVHEAAYLASRALALSPRPGRVVAEVEISGASPRERGFEEGAAYVSACAAIRDALRADAERAA